MAIWVNKKYLLRLIRRLIGDRHQCFRRVNKTRALEIASADEKRGFTFPVGCLASKSTSIENSWSEIRLTRLSHVRVNDYGNVVANERFYTALFSMIMFLVVNKKNLNLIFSTHDNFPPFSPLLHTMDYSPAKFYSIYKNY